MTIRARALALYTPPFRWVGPPDGDAAYVYDSEGHMVADWRGPHGALRVRGWGRIGYLPEPEALQDEVWALIVESGATVSGLRADDVVRKMTELWNSNSAVESIP